MGKVSSFGFSEWALVFVVVCLAAVAVLINLPDVLVNKSENTYSVPAGADPRDIPDKADILNQYINHTDEEGKNWLTSIVERKIDEIEGSSSRPFMITRIVIDHVSKDNTHPDFSKVALQVDIKFVEEEGEAGGNLVWTNFPIYVNLKGQDVLLVNLYQLLFTE